MAPGPDNKLCSNSFIESKEENVPLNLSLGIYRYYSESETIADNYTIGLNLLNIRGTKLITIPNQINLKRSKLNFAHYQSIKPINRD